MTEEDSKKVKNIRSKFSSVFHRYKPVEPIELCPYRGAMVAGKCLDPYTASDRFFGLPKTI
jgi:hypothetical protein